MRNTIYGFVVSCVLALGGCAAQPVWISTPGDMTYYDAYDKAAEYCAPYGKQPRHLGSRLIDVDGQSVVQELFDCR